MKARISFAVDVLGLGDNAALLAPGACECLVFELDKDSGGFLCSFKLLPGLLHRIIKEALYSLVPNHSDNVAHAILLTPGQQLVDGESRIAAQDDALPASAPNNGSSRSCS